MEQLIRSKDFIKTRFVTLDEAAHQLNVPTFRLRQLIRMGIITSDKHEKYISKEQLNSYERIRFHHAAYEQSKPKAERPAASRKKPHV